MEPAMPGTYKGNNNPYFRTVHHTSLENMVKFSSTLPGKTALNHILCSFLEFTQT